MTQEEKALLLRDLCARLPYGVQILVDSDKKFDGGFISRLSGIVPYTGKKYDIQGPLFYQEGCLTPSTIEEIRPYLRPMSSMTKDEKKYIKNRWCYEDWDNINDFLNTYKIDAGDAYSFVDWLYEKHFDFRGLIEKGLALEAPKGMYKDE